MYGRRLYGLLIMLLAVVFCWPAKAQQNVVGSGVYGDVKVTGGATNDLLLEDGVSFLLLEDGSSHLCLESGCP